MNMISAWFLLGACLCLTTASSYNPYNSYQPSESIVNMPPQSVSGSSTDSILDNTPDMCLRNPCLSGLICRSVPPEHVSVGFICVNPNDSDASQVYKNMDLLYQKAIMDNVENIAAGHHDASFDQSSLQQQQQQQGSYPPQQSYPQEQPSLQQQQSYPQQPVSTPNSYERSVSLSLKVNKPMNLTCEQMKCQVGERCVATPNTLEGVICVRERITVVQQENAIIDKLNRDEKFQADTAVRCKAALSTSHQRLDIPGHPTLYVDCMPSDEGKSLTSVIITCTDNLVFNKFLDRCDIDQEPVSSGCASSPCMFGTTCHEADTLGDYRCDCPPGFSGKNCQIAPDVCSVAPCGHSDGNVCHVLPPKSGLTYFCTCFSGKAYGLSCEEDKVEKNPCEENFQVGSVFSTRIGPTVFGMCDQERQLNLRVCDNQMQEMGECKWLSALGQQRRRRGAVSAGHLQKRKTPIRKLHY